MASLIERDKVSYKASRIVEMSVFKCLSLTSPWPTSSSFRCAPYGRPIKPIFIVEIDSTNLKKSFVN
jgi:hypothetical protein